MEPSKTILFINSNMRSGSTILGIILNKHPQITFLGEVRNFHEFIIEKKSCSCGKTLAHCSFWSKVISSFKSDISKSITKTNPGISHRLIKYLSVFNYAVYFFKPISFLLKPIKQEFDVIKNISNIYETVFHLNNTDIICDSSHRNTQSKMMWLKYRLNFLIIHLVRDGRGVTNSVMRRTNCSMKEAAKSWKRNAIFTKLNFLGIPKSNILFVRYEDICSELNNQMQRIYKFIGVDDSSEMISEHKLHFIGGSSTIKIGHINPEVIKIDEKWKRELTEADLSNFDKIAGKINRSFGYM